MAPNVKEIVRDPRTVPGYRVAETLKGTMKRVKLADIAFGDTTPILLANFPTKEVFIESVDLYVETAFDASGTSPAATLVVTIPEATGALTILDTNLTGLQSTGLLPSSVKALTSGSGGQLSLTYTAGSTVAGAARVYMNYQILDE